ncbi:MAG: fibronectin type III, partial [Halothiobacillaceae bacterium]
TNGEVYVAGSTDSTNFPATSGGAQAVSGGGTSLTGADDAFVSRISRSLALVDAPAPTIPGAPVIGTATSGDSQATVSFTAPTSNGGSAITGYTVTSSPGGITATGTASPLTVMGLTNGTAYTFTVTASNAVGQSAASGASNSVTPVAASAPAPTPAPTPAPPPANDGGGGGGGGGAVTPLLLILGIVGGWRYRGGRFPQSRSHQ